jgi:hypothetical protein
MGQENCLKGKHEYCGPSINNMKCHYCGEPYDRIAKLEQRVSELENDVYPVELFSIPEGKPTPEAPSCHHRWYSKSNTAMMCEKCGEVMECKPTPEATPKFNPYNYSDEADPQSDGQPAPQPEETLDLDDPTRCFPWMYGCSHGSGSMVYSMRCKICFPETISLIRQFDKPRVSGTKDPSKDHDMSGDVEEFCHSCNAWHKSDKGKVAIDRKMLAFIFDVIKRWDSFRASSCRVSNQELIDDTEGAVIILRSALERKEAQ